MVHTDIGLPGVIDIAVVDIAVFFPALSASGITDEGLDDCSLGKRIFVSCADLPVCDLV